MTAPTHIIFSISASLLFGIQNPYQMLLVGLGSLICDIDTNKSVIGKIFYPVSNYLSKRYNHRSIAHSILVYLVLSAFFIKFKYIQLFIFGIITHIILDMFNKSGVKFFYPISNRTFVMANRRYRITSGSRNEFILMICLFLIVLFQFKLVQKNGIRGILKEKIASYDQALQDYKNAGLQVCFFNGELRYTNGRIEKDVYMIIGEVGKSVFILNKEKKIVEVPKEAQFLKATTVVRVSEKWKLIKLNEPQTLKSGVAYYRISKKIKRAVSGDIVAGDVLFLDDNLEFGSFE